MPLIPEQDRVKEDLSGDGGVVKVKTSDGGGQKPVDGDIVAVQYVATQGKDGALFDSSRKHMDGGFKFKLGARGPKDLEMSNGMLRPLGWDVGIRSMHVGESAMLYLKAEYAFGDIGLKHPNRPGFIVPPGALVAYNIEVVSIETDVSMLTPAEITVEGESLLDEGNTFFLTNDWEKAEKRYTMALEKVQSIPGIRHDEEFVSLEDTPSLGRKLLVRGLLNIVSCKLKKCEDIQKTEPSAKREIAQEALRKCTAAIDIMEAMNKMVNLSEEAARHQATFQHSTLAKAYYRRGKIYLTLRQEMKAKENLHRACELAPQNKTIRKEYAEVKSIIKDARKQEKLMFGGLMKNGERDFQLYDDMSDIPAKIADSQPTIVSRVCGVLWNLFCCKYARSTPEPSYGPMPSKSKRHLRGSEGKSLGTAGDKHEKSE